MIDKHHIRRPKPQDAQERTDEYERDLNPARTSEQNIGQSTEYLSAADVKELTRADELKAFTKDELREIPVVPEGSHLKRGKTYVNLRVPGCRPFTASPDMVAGADDWIIPKTETPRPYWNRLIGVEDVRRTE